MGSLYRRKLASGHRSRVWTAKFYVNGAPLRVSTGCEDRGEAKDWLRQKEGQVAKGEPIVPRYDRVRYDEIAKDLRQEYQTNGSRNLKEAEIRLAHLDRHFRGWRALRIGRPEVIAYCQKRQEEGASNATINREITVLKRMFRLAYEDKKVPRIPPVKLLKESAPRQGFFEPDAYEAVCRHLPPHGAPGGHVCLCHRLACPERGPAAHVGAGGLEGWGSAARAWHDEEPGGADLPHVSRTAVALGSAAGLHGKSTAGAGANHPLGVPPPGHAHSQLPQGMGQGVPHGGAAGAYPARPAEDRGAEHGTPRDRGTGRHDPRGAQDAERL